MSQPPLARRNFYNDGVKEVSHVTQHCEIVHNCTARLHNKNLYSMVKRQIRRTTRCLQSANYKLQTIRTLKIALSLPFR